MDSDMVLWAGALVVLALSCALLGAGLVAVLAGWDSWRLMYMARQGMGEQPWEGTTQVAACDRCGEGSLALRARARVRFLVLPPGWHVCGARSQYVHPPRPEVGA